MQAENKYRLDSEMFYVYEKIADIAIGKSKDVNMNDTPVYLFRMCMSKISDDYGIMFKTRLNKENNTLNIKRII